MAPPLFLMPCFSRHCVTDAQKVWIITETDRSATTILLPDDY